MPALLLADVTGAAQIPLSLLVVFASAKLLSEIFERLGQPGIVGEILAGVLVGPQVLGWLAPSEALRLLSELGVMFLLFRVGLEVKASELIRVGGTAMAVAMAGVIVPFAAGWGICRWWGEPRLESLFTGAAMVATSVGITAQVLASRRLLNTEAARIILAAAVVDDVLGLIVLALVGGAARGSLNYLDSALSAGLAVAFTGFVAFFGRRTVNRVMPRVQARARLAEAEFALAITLLFGLALLAVYAGVAAIVGAFLAGMALSETVDRRMTEMTQGVTELLVPFFLVGIGLHFDVSALATRSSAGLAALIVAGAAVSKLAACGLGALRMGRIHALRVGVGMIPRGEVGMVVAQIGLGMGVMAPNIYGIIVLMSVVTTLLAPPLVKITFRGAEADVRMGDAAAQARRPAAI